MAAVARLPCGDRVVARRRPIIVLAAAKLKQQRTGRVHLNFTRRPTLFLTSFGPPHATSATLTDDHIDTMPHAVLNTNPQHRSEVLSMTKHALIMSRSS
jgi:hypothetical protein